MCGITGFWNLAKSQTNDELTSIITRMWRDRIHHRGPDDSGEWVDQGQCCR